MNGNNATETMSFEIKKQEITFSVDYYVELLGVISILCEDQEAIDEAGCVRCNQKYVDEVKAFFRNSDYKSLTQELVMLSDKYYFNYDAPVWLMLKLSSKTPITAKEKEELFYGRETIPDEILEKFICDLIAFEKSSDFRRFFELHYPLYETVIDHYIADFEKYNAHEFLLSFLKVETGFEYHINLMLGITNANYGVTVGNKVYSNNRPYNKTRYHDMPDFSYDALYFTTLIVHEFAHSFINVLVSNHRDEINLIDRSKYADLLDELGYGISVETLINEHIIRAIECLYVKQYFGKWYDQYINFNIEDGYLKLREIIDLLSASTDIKQIVELFK